VTDATDQPTREPCGECPRSGRLWRCWFIYAWLSLAVFSGALGVMAWPVLIYVPFSLWVAWTYYQDTEA
jgi:hypothetical protein